MIIIPYENRFITDLKEKAELSKFFFSKKCFLIPNNSSLFADFNCITDKCLSTVTFSAKHIGKFIQNLHLNQDNGPDNVSIMPILILRFYLGTVRDNF